MKEYEADEKKTPTSHEVVPPPPNGNIRAYSQYKHDLKAMKPSPVNRLRSKGSARYANSIFDQYFEAYLEHELEPHLQEVIDGQFTTGGIFHCSTEEFRAYATWLENTYLTRSDWKPFTSTGGEHGSQNIRAEASLETVTD